MEYPDVAEALARLRYRAVEKGLDRYSPRFAMSSPTWIALAHQNANHMLFADPAARAHSAFMGIPIDIDETVRFAEMRFTGGIAPIEG